MKFLIPAIAMVSLAPAHADVLISHAFGGSSGSPLNGVSPDTNLIRPVSWNAGSIIAANGQVTDGTNTDQGAVFDLGLSWKFKSQSTYTVNLAFTKLDNAIVFAGFRTANPSGGVQAQTQGTCVALRVREITGSDNVGIFQWPGGTFTNAAELTYDTNASANFTLQIQTNNLTDAVVSVGSAQITVDLSGNLFRYFFIGFEDPTTLTPASDAKYESVTFEGPPPPPLPKLNLVSVDSNTGEKQLSWSTTSGELYALQGSTDLKNWIIIDNSDLNPFSGTGDPMTFLDTRNDSRFFYRLIRP